MQHKQKESNITKAIWRCLEVDGSVSKMKLSNASESHRLLLLLLLKTTQKPGGEWEEQKKWHEKRIYDEMGNDNFINSKSTL